MLRILVMLAALVLLILPFLPIRLPFTLFFYNFPEDKRHKNIVYILTTLVIALLTILLMPQILDLADWFANLSWVKWIIDKLPNYATYTTAVFKAVFANVLYCAVVLLVNALGGGIFGLFRKKKTPEEQKAAEERKAARKAAWKAFWEKITGAFKKKDPQEQDKEEQPEEPVLPEHLVPAPEKPDHSGKIRLFGKTETQRRQPSDLSGSSAASDSEAEPQEKNLLSVLFGFFYWQREDGWYVQPQCKKVAKHLRNFLVLAGLVYITVFTLLMIPIFFPVETFAKDFYNAMNALVANCYLYPCISLVLLTEVFWFMNGRLPEEPVAEPAQDAQLQRGRVVDLDKVEQNLMKTYGKTNQVKSFHSEDVLPVEQTRSPVDLSEEPLLLSIASFVQRQGLVRNDDYLRGILALTRGSDVLFDAPLYTSAGMYLYPYLSMRISQGDRIVVVCRDRDEIPKVIENLEQGFRRVLRTHECLWRVHRREDLRDDNQTDVLVLTPEDFREDRLYEEGKEFFPGVTLVMLPDADRVITANNYSCLVMAERLRQHSGKTPQYLFLSTRHNLNLAGSLTQYFMLDKAIHTVQAEYAYGNVQMYVWKARNDGATLLDNSAQTIPLEVGIAKIAQAGGIPNINLVSGSAIFPNQVNPKWLDAYDAADRPIGFAVVADDGYNLPGVIYTYSRYMGKEASILHVISRPYLLRDYFYDSAARSLYEQPLMERGIAEHALPQRSGMILLLCRLMEGISVEAFALQMQRLTHCTVPRNLNFPALKALVEQCLQIAFGPSADAHPGFMVWEEADQRFRQVRKIRIVEDGILNRLLADTSLVTVRFTGNRPDVRIGLFRKMLDQRYLTGQNLIYDHRNYEVISIDRQNGVILVDDANSVHNVPDDYIQVRHYSLSDTTVFAQGIQAITDGTGDTADSVTGTRIAFQGKGGIRHLTMVRSLNAMEITSDTVSYYPVHGNAERLDLTDSTVAAIHLPKKMRDSLLRKVGGALYLRLEGDFVRSDRLTMTLAVLLQEMMKTLFPDQYFCLAVCPILEDPDSIYSHRDHHSRQIAGMYPRLTGWGRPEPNAIELLLVDDCQGGTGVLDRLYSREATYLLNVLDMLGDYLTWLQNREEGSYLYFGSSECPALYDLPGLRRLLKVFSHTYIREHDLLQDLHLTNCCPFCGSTLNADDSYLWNNDLSICGQCRKDHTPTQEESTLILAHIRRFLSDRFGVTLPEGLTVKVEKRKELSGLDTENSQIILSPELPLVTVHSELLNQCVRLWQLENLRMTGEPEFEGQILYVLLQYLEELQQFQRRRRFHRQALLGTDDRSVGYCLLRQALQTLNTDNSFRYMLDNFPKGSVPPVRKTTKRRSTRITNPENIRRSFYEALSSDEKQAYDLLIDGFMAMSPEILLPGLTISQKRFDCIWESALADHPELFWVIRRYYDYTPGSSAEQILGVIPSYNMSVEERQRRKTATDEVTEQLLAHVTPEMGDFDVALLLYELLSEEMDYDSLALDRQERRWEQLKQRNQRDETPDDLRSIYGALVEKRGVCAGYAKAYQHLLQKVGIECIYVRGHCLEGGYHAWNIVKLEGNYYHVDVTWGDGSNTDPAKDRKEISYNYFCLTDSEICLSRNIDADPPSPACTATSCNYFVRMGLFYEAYDHRSVRQQLLARLEDPNTTRLDLRFSNASVLQAAQQHLLHGGGIQEILHASGRASLDHYRVDSDLHVLSFFFDPGA